MAADGRRLRQLQAPLRGGPFRELGLASEGLLRRVLGVADDLDRALEHVPPEEQGSAWVEGIAAIERKVSALLVAEGVTPIEAVGTPFDPRAA